MKPGFTLSIPKPCSENWNSFTPTATGGFCGSCQKNVIDFTKATDDEIIAFISKKPEHVCGRFRSSQLKTYTIVPEIRLQTGFPLFKAGALSLFILLLSKHASAQTVYENPMIEIVQVTTAQTPSTQQKSDKIIIRGTVTSKDDQSVLPAVSIVQKGTANGTMTDAEGKFELTINLREGHLLQASFIGMVTKEIALPQATEVRLNIAMDSDVTGLLGEVIWTGEAGVDTLYSEHKSGFEKFIEKVRRLFRG